MWLFLLVVDFCFLSTSQEISWEEHLRNDLFYVELDVEPPLNQSVRLFDRNKIFIGHDQLHSGGVPMAVGTVADNVPLEQKTEVEP